MADRIEKDAMARLLAARLDTDAATAEVWIDGIVETLYESSQERRSAAHFAQERLDSGKDGQFELPFAVLVNQRPHSMV